MLCFYEENKLSPKALFLLDNAPGHHQNFDEERTHWILKFLTHFPIQHLFCNQWIRELLQHSKLIISVIYENDESLDTSDKIVKIYWQSFDILEDIENIKSAWDEV